ncbi:MAG: GPW/gp25 family protein [Flavobacteriaceae bacterium]|jgi:phage baseplate assembly protein W|nr:GPW/gp25 family protein [Flavobacteriaceae bacterium]MDG2386533.1 GPW/gp25 family protein [Flavobacteriaceae bacterium]
MEDLEKSFLGKGWSFPPTFDKKLGDVKMVTMEEDIRQSLEIYFSTKLGERIMRNDYGCFLHSQVFELANESLIQGLSKELERSINEFEPRILITEITASKAESTEGLIEINIAYEIRATNNRSNIVFPFYLNEGTSIKK